MALVNPHPALKVSVPMNPMVDGWMGDDWFHNGAFRAAEDALHLRPGGDAQAARRSGGPGTTTTTTCSWRRARRASWAGATAWSRSASGGRSSSTRAYDAFWREQAVDKLPGRPAPEGAGDARPQPLGPGGHLRRHRRLQGHRAEGHRQRQGASWSWAPGTTGRRSARAARWARCASDSDTALSFRREILRPFLDQYLKDGAPKADVAPVTAFETGTNTWRRLPGWPAGCASGCTVTADALLPGRRAEERGSTRRRPAMPPSTSTSRIPPSRCPSARPGRSVGYDAAQTWRQWLVGRPARGLGPHRRRWPSSPSP